jgi:hypothetical protein
MSDPSFEFHEGYDVAQVCLNGHVVNFFAGSLPEHNENFCSTCGEKTIIQCPHCNTKIRGHYHMFGATSFLPEVSPAFCHNCGKPYPWMEDRLETAKELLYHDDKLSLDDREKLWGLLRYVMSDPKSDLAPAKKKLFEIGIVKALPATREFLLDLMAKYGAEMSKP